MSLESELARVVALVADYGPIVAVLYAAWFMFVAVLAGAVFVTVLRRFWRNR